MVNPVRRLVESDHARHGAIAPSAATPAPTGEEGNWSSVGSLAGMLGLNEDPTPPPVPHPEVDEDSVEPIDELGAASPPLQTPVTAPRVEAEARPETVNILLSLCPVIRASYVFPGVDVPVEQMAAAVKAMSFQVVSISDALARDCDPLEIDQSWMRARMGTFVSELVASAWVSTAIHRQRLTLRHQDAAPSPESEIERLAACVTAAMQAIEGSSYGATAGSRVAAVVSLSALVFQLEGYRRFITRALPQVEVDLGSATRRVGEAMAEEVASVITRLSAHVPEALHGELASELTSQGVKFVFDAQATACGEVFSALDRIREQSGSVDDAVALLNAPAMDGGVPVDRIIELMRGMFRHVVATIEGSAKALLGGGHGRPVR